MEELVVKFNNLLYLTTGKAKEILPRNIEIFIFSLIFIYKNIAFNTITGAKAHNTLGYLGTVLILLGLTIWLRRRTRIIALFLINVFISIIMYADVLYSRYFSGVITASVLKQVGMVESVQSGILSLINRIDAIFAIDLIICIPLIIYMFFKGRIPKLEVIPKRRRVSVVLLLSGIILIFFTFISMDIQKINTNGYDQMVNKMGILNFHAYDVFSEVLKSSIGKKSLPDNEANEIMNYVVNKNKTRQDINAKYFGVSKGTNLIVIQVEALQNDLLGMKINGKEITPNLNKFVKRSMYFKNYFSETYLGQTSDAELLSNTSYYPMKEGSVFLNYLSNTFEALPKTLKELGYNTFAMHADNASYYNRSTMYPLLGFDKFYDKKDYKIDEIVGVWGLGDKSFLKQSFEMLQKEKQPFNSFIITLSSHFPYEAFEDNMVFDAAQFNHTYFGNYIKSIHYADAALGEFLDNLEKSGLMDNSTIAIYGDHWGVSNDMVGGEIGDFLKLPKNNYVRWMDIVKVPLIIHLPNDKEAGVKEITGGQVDFFPTIANLYGIKPKYTLGQDLLNAEKQIVFRRDGYITDGKTLYEEQQDTCFDLNTGDTVDKAPFMKYIDEAQKQQSISDKVIENNLIKYFENHSGK